MVKEYDFGGWATRNNLTCSDGRVIRKDAFMHDDGHKVPLVWNHQHNDPLNVLGHAILENRDSGVYAYCTLNDTEAGRNAKMLVEHGDVSSLSIYANQLKQRGSDVIHGTIREVSLVLAGANPGAYIDNVIRHGETFDDEAVIFMHQDIQLVHSEDEEKVEVRPKDEEQQEELAHAESKKEGTQNMANENTNQGDSKPESEETVQDVIDTMTPKQKNVMYAMIGQVLEDYGIDVDEDDDDNDKSEGGNNSMKHNVWDMEEETNQENVLSHSEMMEVIGDAKRYGSMKDAFLAHGIEQVDYLFPEPKTLNTPPEFIKRDTGWVQKLMGSVHHTPFSRIKSMFADITEDEARAKGYMKGKLKKDEVFGLLKRTTTPTTVYKKQKMDRDDVIDITDFDVIAWLKGEMRMMLDEEIARAVLVGDGRLASSDDKINEQNIRPIWTDEELYTIRSVFTVSNTATEDDKAKAFIRAAIKSRKDYKGSGNPILFTTEDILTDCLLLTDEMGRDLYESPQKLATKLRVREIVTVEVMEGLKREGNSLYGIIVNPADYNIGADKGGAVNMFDDFDIDYNQQKYLIETRCSGALIKPYSAIALECKVSA